MVTPILKWAGGKRQLLDEIYSRFPETYQNGVNSFHEPFLGSGALFFDHEPTNATVNDLNPRLCNFYQQVRDRPEELIQAARSFNDPNSEPSDEEEFSTKDRKGRDIDCYYYQQRALFNRRPNGEDFDLLQEAARLLYLNRTCFNGLYRENQMGEFNVPIGGYTNPDWIRAEQIHDASEHLGQLSRDDISAENFDYVINRVEEGDLVYLDPPYEPLSSTASFAEYSSCGFGQESQKYLLETAKRLDEMNVWVILSNSGVMFDFYSDADFHVQFEGATRAINSDGSNRGEVDEIIATNVPPGKRKSDDHTTLTS